VGTARRIKIDNVVAHNIAAESGIFIVGLPDNPVEDLSLSNIFMDFAGGGTKEQGERAMPEDPKAYPEPSKFGTIPAWGLWARHVRGLSLDRVEFRFARDDFRPTVILDDVSEARLDSVKLPHAAGAASIVLRNVDGFALLGRAGIADVVRGKVGDERF